MNAQELKDLREHMNLTQQQLADRLFITRDAICKLEAGKNKMSKPVQELLRQLAESPAAN